ncbi:MAG: aminotransferase class I/II-fold pyridoxal phosphate-dependent enzyme [Deltaproteobacteria bacterium]|nr:aminotransferase class I/II-fold pyridoxal phosphate-dependent enzyme [Deltaproteobacteria bacterium]
MSKHTDHLSLSDLAIFGGKPAFGETLHVGRPNIGDRRKLIERIEDILDRRWLTNNGPMVREFERRLSDLLGVRHCITMDNATLGLEIATRAAGMTGEVIVPSFTFVATAHALQWQEITPVFCDIDPRTHTIDPDRVERLITPRTTGIIGVHLWGRACNIGALEEIARHNNLRLLFDAAHAFGCTYNGRMIGNFGDAEVFSFHATKFINTFEGGLVTTNNDELAGKIRLMKNFGFAGLDNVIYIGANGKMNEVSAAMGLTSLESMDKFIEVNQRNYHTYKKNLSGIPGISLLEYNTNEANNYQYVVIELDEEVAGLNRDLLIRILHAENVRARRYFYPGCHRMEPYHSYYPNAYLLLPETEKLVRKVVVLPTGTAIGEAAIEKICTLIRFIIAGHKEILSRLGED